MKTRFLIPTCLGLMAFGIPTVRAFLPPGRAPLANYDKRDTAVAAAATQAQLEAEAALRTSVPDLRVSRDKVLGSVRFVTTPQGFLSRSGGNGQAPLRLAVAATDPHSPIKNFLNEQAALFGHDASVLANARIKRDYVTAHNGLRTVIWEQVLDGIPVFDGLLMGHITSKGELVSVSSRFVADAAAAADAGTANRAALVSAPVIAAAEALVKAASDVGADVSIDSVVPVDGNGGPEMHQRFMAPQLNGNSSARLVWLPMNNTSMRLCWQVLLTSHARGEMYLLLVDARTGEVLVRRCLTNYLTNATYNVFTKDSPAPMLPGLAVPSTVQAATVPRDLITLSALSTNASPNGWINDADIETKGNNVDAHTDLDADDLPDLPRPQATNRVFDFPLDLARSPLTYSRASVVNLFYRNNFMHDHLYDIGFTEAAGNFQDDNFGRGGVGNDAVQADAQDGGGVDNANFSTPPDGEPGRMQMYVFIDPEPDRDGDLDAVVMCHEYTHGLSNRLVGGGVGISELQPSGMGEGWSDFYGLSLVSPTNSDPHANYPGGAYLTYLLGGLRENYYYGIRRYPYSTEMAVNPLTFKDIDPSQADSHPGVPISPIFGGSNPSEVHNQGEVWCVTLWEARANLIDKLGYADGNRMILQLVTDGMKLSPPNPTFIEARDAIIAADDVATGGDNRNELWLAFAKRGMGFSARAPSPDTTVGVVESFDLPDDVIISPPDGILEVAVTPPSSSALFASDRQPIFVRVTDGFSVTNAVIVATATDGSVLNFTNNGVSPDVTAGNSVYSALYNVPTNITSVNISLVISAPGKVTSTNIVHYDIIGLPQNDRFLDAIKVPPTGAFYTSNNKFATIEQGEPKHAGVTSSAASLWWTWSSPVTTNVLVDTGTSLFDTLIGVYTGTQVGSLTNVASANDIGTRRQAFVTFQAVAGTAYRIAVASSSPNGTGTLHLRIVPGGFADTSAPVVTIDSPRDGFVFTTNLIVLSGTATDPQPGPSGINRILISTTSSENPGEGSEIIVTNNAANSIVEKTNWTQFVALTRGLNTIRVRANDVAGNVSSSVFLHVTYLPRDPINDLFNNAIVLTNASGVSSVNSLSAGKETGEPVHAGNNGGKSVWWSVVPVADGVLTLSTTNSTFDTLMALYTTNVGVTGTVTFSNLTVVANNDDAYEGVSFSKISQPVRGNRKYWIAVDGFDAASGVVYLSHNFSSSNLFHLTINTIESGSVVPGSGDYAAGGTVVLTAVPQTGYEFVQWEGDVASSANPLPVVVNANLTLTARFRAHVFTDSFESGSFTALPWVNDANHPWVIESTNVSFGQYAARSGVITDGQSSTLELTITSGGGVGAFDYRVSSETNWDWLEFYLNGVPDSVQPLQHWSGEVGWATYQFSIPAGTNTLVWRYIKDPTTSVGSDAAFIDNLEIPPVPTLPTSLRLLNPTVGGFQIQFQAAGSQSVRVQGSSDLVSWQDLWTSVLSNGAVVQFSDPQAPYPAYRFYRAVSP